MDEARLARLEKQNRWLARWLGATTLLFVATGALGAWQYLGQRAGGDGAAKELRTERLVIVGPSGNEIGVFGRDENGGFIQVGGGEALVTILAGKAGSVVAQHGQHMSYMSADRDVCLFKVSSPNMEAAVKSTISADESAFWVSSQGKGRVYLGINRDYGSSGFLRSDRGETVWEASERKAALP